MFLCVGSHFVQVFVHYTQMKNVPCHPLFAAADIACAMSLFCDCETTAAHHSTNRLGWHIFSVSQLKTKMVVDWLLHRVDDIIDHYFLACQRVCWVDSDVEEDDADAVHALHLHSASCASLYCDYSVMLLKAFTMDPDLLRPELWPLMFALEMVTDEEVQMREHADAFFLGRLGQHVRGVLRNVIAKLK